MYHETRETWLRAAIEYMQPWFNEQGHEIPDVYVSIGFPSTGARGSDIGQCHYTSKDGKPYLFIHPKLGTEDGTRVLDILVHELVHATLPVGSGHGPKFRKLAKGLGLEGAMTATVATPELTWTLGRMIKYGLGPYPHSALGTLTGLRKKQTTRMLKIICPDVDCGYQARTTRTWLESKGFPICPCGKEMVLG